MRDLHSTARALLATSFFCDRKDFDTLDKHTMSKSSCSVTLESKGRLRKLKCESVCGCAPWVLPGLRNPIRQNHQSLGSALVNSPL